MFPEVSIMFPACFHLLDQCSVPKSDDVVYPVAHMQLAKHGQTTPLPHTSFPDRSEHCLCAISGVSTAVPLAGLEGGKHRRL